MNRSSLTTVVVAAAVLAAVSGTSYAAGSLITGDDVKNGSLTGQDVKDKSLTKKDFKGSVRGPAGATGPQGPAGAQGVPGVQGPAGPFPGVLPRGKTVIGTYSITGVASGAGQYFDNPLSFGFRFASAPTVVIVGIDDTPAEATAAGCPGTPADPQAAPGRVCVYEMGNDNVGTVDMQETDGDDAHVGGYTPPAGDWGTATTGGTILEVLSGGAGNLYSNGTWAATSP